MLPIICLCCFCSCRDMKDMTPRRWNHTSMWSPVMMNWNQVPRKVESLIIKKWQFEYRHALGVFGPPYLQIISWIQCFYVYLNCCMYYNWQRIDSNKFGFFSPKSKFEVFFWSLKLKQKTLKKCDVHVHSDVRIWICALGAIKRSLHQGLHFASCQNLPLWILSFCIG